MEELNEKPIKKFFLKKEICEAITSNMLAGAKTLYFFVKYLSFHLIVKIQLLCGFRIAIGKIYL